MIRSMTGYGQGKEEIDMVDIMAEIRSVNHRYLDITVKAPKIYGFLDDAVKKRVGLAAGRGKVDVYLSIDTSRAQAGKIFLNRPIFEEYLKVLKEIGEEYNVPGTPEVMDLARLPEVLGTKKEEADAEKLTASVLRVLDQALQEFEKMRAREGECLRKDILCRLDAIGRLLDGVAEKAPLRVEEYREKLAARMKELLAGADVDPSRILTEAALFADKIAVDEELVRLKSHMGQLEKMLAEGGAVGRKLDFIVQEMNREANTIGAKSNDLDMTRLVVDIKAEIEKIREQAQNIE